MKALARLELLGSAVCFALMSVLARRISRQFTAGHLALVRFAVGALAALLLFRLRKGLFRPHDYRSLVARGVSGALAVILYFLALAKIPAAEAGMLYNLFPVIATVLSIFIFHERPTLHLAIALLGASAGVALMLGHGSLSIHLGVGGMAALVAALFGAISANIIRGMRGTDNAPTIYFFFCLAGLPVAAPFALDRWPAELVPWLLAIAMGLCAFAAQVLMTQAYGALSVAEAAVWLQLNPVAQTALGFVLLGESIEWTGAAGMVLAVASVAYGSVLGRVPPQPP
jgi:drug/metabolite transporter (DMT)-like permease